MRKIGVQINKYCGTGVLPFLCWYALICVTRPSIGYSHRSMATHCLSGIGGLLWYPWHRCPLLGSPGAFGILVVEADSTYKFVAGCKDMQQTSFMCHSLHLWEGEVSHLVMFSEHFKYQLVNILYFVDINLMFWVLRWLHWWWRGCSLSCQHHDDGSWHAWPWQPPWPGNVSQWLHSQ